MASQRTVAVARRHRSSRWLASRRRSICCTALAWRQRQRREPWQL